MLTIKFPLTCITGGSKLAYAYGLQEKLQLEHNVEGARYNADMAKFAKGEITDADRTIAEARWDSYKTNLFGPASDLIVQEVLKWRAYAKAFHYWNPDLSKDIINVVEP